MATTYDTASYAFEVVEARGFIRQAGEVFYPVQARGLGERCPQGPVAASHTHNPSTRVAEAGES